MFFHFFTLGPHFFERRGILFEHFLGDFDFRSIWGAIWGALGGLWVPLGALGELFGSPSGALGDPLGALGILQGT